MQRALEKKIAIWKPRFGAGAPNQIESWRWRPQIKSNHSAIWGWRPKPNRIVALAPPNQIKPQCDLGLAPQTKSNRGAGAPKSNQTTSVIWGWRPQTKPNQIVQIMIFAPNCWLLSDCNFDCNFNRNFNKPHRCGGQPLVHTWQGPRTTLSTRVGLLGSC